MKLLSARVAFCIAIVLISADYAISHSHTTLKLTHLEPKRVFDKYKAPANAKGPFRDSRVPQAHRLRDDVPLGGGIGTLGTYYAEIQVNGQPFRVIVDTGSSILYIPSTECTLSSGPDRGQPCHSSNPPLSPSASGLTAIPCDSEGCTCSTNDECRMTTTYGDGSSVVANGYKTQIQVGNLVASSASFGLFFESSQGFVNEVGTVLDGLWGLGYQTYPGNSLQVVTPLLDSLFADNPSVSKIFSINLDADGSQGGLLTIGGVEQSFLSNTTVYYTDIIAEGWYVVNNPQIAVGTSVNTLGEGNGGVTTNADTSDLNTIIDTGATLIVMPSIYWNALRDAMQSVVGCDVKYMCGDNSVWSTAPNAENGGSHLCYTDFPVNSFPTIAFIFPKSGKTSPVAPSTQPSSQEHIQLILTPQQYMISSVDTQGRPCLAFGFDLSSSNFLILGDTILTRFYTIFDRTNSVIGFAPKDQSGLANPPQIPIAPSGNLSPENSSPEKQYPVLAALVGLLTLLLM